MRFELVWIDYNVHKFMVTIKHTMMKVYSNVYILNVTRDSFGMESF